MSIARMVYVRCDRCGHPEELADDAREARRRLPSDWARVEMDGRRLDWCPKCIGLGPSVREVREGFRRLA